MLQLWIPKYHVPGDENQCQMNLWCFFARLFSCSREKELAKKYYDKLFKEYCIADLSRYKENKVGWTDDMIQTEIQP